jgi:hypothetical protein
MTYNSDYNDLLDVGKEPLLLEPVKVNLEFKRKEKYTVHVLDHLGRKTGKTIISRGGKVVLDGGATLAFYYLIEYASP